jgi:rubrerythrin
MCKKNERSCLLTGLTQSKSDKEMNETMNADDAKKIISTAIDREVEAYTFYRTVSEKVKDPALKKLFIELAGEEKQHREFLQGMFTKDVSKMHFEAKKDYKVVNALPSPPLSADMKPLDGIVVSIKKELEAMQMYTQLANLSTDTEQKFLFSQLANMESGHKARLEDLYTNMAFPEVW